MADVDARGTGSTTGSAEGGGDRPIAHDDIMRRLLEYQRQLREGVPPSEAARAVAESDPSALRAGPAAETATASAAEPVVDLTRAEAELEAEGATTEPEVPEAAARVETEAPAAAEAESVSAAEPSAGPAAPPSPTVEPGPPAEPSAVWAVPTADPGLTARVERLERTLDEIATQVSDLRQRFQDLAIAADERLAELERTLARARER
ncbi:MAG: hypothetical protein KatS3mg014_2194 [Actinomycetota bacterium]|nr:MAG: hypothetical protein KatS3mg014_2194 [Actinomycetota bacterium]